MKYTYGIYLRLIFLVLALGLAIFLALDMGGSTPPDHAVVFVLDINRTMNTQDVLSGTNKISRLTAAKSLIATTICSHPDRIYGLIIFNHSADYFVPPTFDTGTLLLYLSGITTNLLPDGPKNFASLSGMLQETNASYLILSDFDTSVAYSDLPSRVTLIGLGTSEGDVVRYANGVRYYDSGVSVTSIRNDQIATSFGVTYTPVSDISTFRTQTMLYRRFTVPLSQRILLYTLLGVLVILAIMF